MPKAQKSWILPEKTHQTMVDNLTEKFGFDRALSYEVDEDGKVYARHGKGIDPKNSSYYNGRFPDPGEIIDMALYEGKEQLVLNPETDPRCSREKIKRDKTKSFAVIPIEKKGRVVSLVAVNNWESGTSLEDKWEVFKKIREGFLK